MEDARVGKGTFTVPIVRRQLVSLWHDYWDKGTPTKEALKANRRGALDKSASVEADSAVKAARKAEAENPGHVAIFDAIKRHP
jgi:hypothetical protein